MTARSILIWVTVVVLVLIGVLGGVRFREHRRYQRGFEQVRHKMRIGDVMGLLGEPSRTQECSVTAGWDVAASAVDPSCTTEYWYESRLSPDQWVVGFNESGEAVMKYHVVSP
jgi:hypothetical protein